MKHGSGIIFLSLLTMVPVCVSVYVCVCVCVSVYVCVCVCVGVGGVHTTIHASNVIVYMEHIVYLYRYNDTVWSRCEKIIH